MTSLSVLLDVKTKYGGILDKKIAFILSIMAILALSTVGFAENAIIAQVKFDTPIGQNGENPRIIFLGDTLYDFSRREGRILSWKPGEESMKVFSSLPKVPVAARVMAYRDMDTDTRVEMELIVTHVLAGDGKLWALNQYSGKFGQINEKGVDYTHTLDLSDLNPEMNNDVDYLFPGFVSEDHLYLFSVRKQEGFFARYDLATGERQDIALHHQLGAVYPYNSECALYVADTRTDQNDEYAKSIFKLELATGVLTPMDIHLPEGALKNASTYIKGLYPVEPGNELYCFVESGGGQYSNCSLLVVDKSGSIKTDIALPQSANGFYYLSQPMDAQRVIAVDAYGAIILNIK